MQLTTIATVASTFDLSIWLVVDAGGGLITIDSLKRVIIINNSYPESKRGGSFQTNHRLVSSGVDSSLVAEKNVATGIIRKQRHDEAQYALLEPIMGLVPSRTTHGRTR